VGNNRLVTSESGNTDLRKSPAGQTTELGWGCGRLVYRLPLSAAAAFGEVIDRLILSEQFASDVGITDDVVYSRDGAGRANGLRSQAFTIRRANGNACQANFPVASPERDSTPGQIEALYDRAGFGPARPKPP